jgi:hypothetical protein
MSWFRNFIGRAEHVAVAVEGDIAHIAEDDWQKINRKVAAFEADITRTVDHLFYKVPRMGKLGVHVESQGHFNEDGTGKTTIVITSTATPIPVTAVASDVPVEAPPATETPPQT